MGMELNSHKTQIIVAIIALIGVLGGALITNWGKVSSQNQGSQSKQEPPAKNDERMTERLERKENVPAPSPSPTPEVNINGAWRDTWGIQSQVTQHGDTYQFTAWGTACNGIFQSYGSGTIRGNIVESTYQSTYSEGRCSGTVSADGRQMTSTCFDSVCGQFQSIATRR